MYIGRCVIFLLKITFIDALDKSSLCSNELYNLNVQFLTQILTLTYFFRKSNKKNIFNFLFISLLEFSKISLKKFLLGLEI